MLTWSLGCTGVRHATKPWPIEVLPCTFQFITVTGTVLIMKALEFMMNHQIWSEIKTHPQFCLHFFSFLYPLCLLDDKLELEILMSTKVKFCDKGFACLLCGRTIKAKHHMKNHMKDTHMKPRQYKCPPCNKILTNRSIEKHVSKYHPDWHGIDIESFRVHEGDLGDDIWYHLCYLITKYNHSACAVLRSRVRLLPPALYHSDYC